MIEPMLSNEEVISIVYHLLSKMQEGITDFKFHEIKRQSADFLLVSVGYSWHFNGQKKPIDKIERSFYKENGIWKILT